MATPVRLAARAAFPATIPILAGFTFLGAAYGIYMTSLGFHPIFPILMSFFIFAGSIEFITANLLLMAFAPFQAFLLAIMVNARHLFYGLSMLDKYHSVGKKKFYLIFGMCDESFSINYTTKPDPSIDKGWFMFFVTLYNHMYWVGGSTLGALLGQFITFNTEGLLFVMTALFVVIFLENWLQEKRHTSALIGLVISILALMVFGANQFVIPAMIGILVILIAFRKPLERREVKPL